MAPPDYPGIPGLAIRPRPPNPPPPESLPPSGPAIRDAQVALAHGKWKLSMTPTAALVLLACVACAGMGYFAARRAPPEDTSGIVRDVRASLSAKAQDDANFQSVMLHRLEGLETQVSRLQDSQDRLRERVNDRLNSQP